MADINREERESPRDITRTDSRSAYDSPLRKVKDLSGTIKETKSTINITKKHSLKWSMMIIINYKNDTKILEDISMLFCLYVILFSSFPVIPFPFAQCVLTIIKWLHAFGLKMFQQLRENSLFFFLNRKFNSMPEVFVSVSVYWIANKRAGENLRIYIYDTPSRTHVKIHHSALIIYGGLPRKSAVERDGNHRELMIPN